MHISIAAHAVHGAPPNPHAITVGLVSQLKSWRQHPKRQLSPSQRVKTHAWF
jgi:hypothetical protein